MADNSSSAKLEEKIMNLNISNIPCSSAVVISSEVTNNYDSNNDDIKNITYSKSKAVKTKVICSDNPKSERAIISSKNKNVRCNEESLNRDENDSDWEDIDENDSDWEDIDDNDDTDLLSDVNSVKNIDNHVDTAVLSDDNDSNWEDIDDDDSNLEDIDDDDNNLEDIDDNDNDGDSSDTIVSSDDNCDSSSSNSQNCSLLTDPIFLMLDVEQAKIYFFMNSNPVAKRFIHEASTFEDNTMIYDKDEIVEIVDGRFIKNRLFYLVKWKNWSQGFNTWEPLRTLYRSLDHIFEFQQKNKFSDKPTNIMHLMLNRQIITQLFELFRTVTGLSLPLTTLEEVSDLCNAIGHGSKSTRKLRKLCLKSQLATLSLDFFRQQQEHELKQWEIDINLVSQNYNIKVENNMDLEYPPNSFVYILHYYIPEGGIIIPDNPPPSCLCKNDCSYSANCCKKLTSLNAYNPNQNMALTTDVPIFECNKKCKCLPSCINRVVQYGSKVKVRIYKSRFSGWALKTSQNIDKGQFVGIYVGEIITVEEYNRRLQNFSSSIDYTWKLDFNDTNNFKCIIDSTHYGNFTRFINHSCEANLSIKSVWINCLDRYFPQLALFADRNICTGEELTIDYFINRGKDSLKKSGIKCQCQMKECKGYYF